MKHHRAIMVIAAAGILLLTHAMPAVPEDIRIVAPYLGSITDIQKDDSQGMDLTDTKLIEGLYGQWINPDLYQWNVFVYHSVDLNYSTVWGGHFILDLYLGPGDWGGKFVAGAGIELMRFDMDAGNDIAPLTDFTQGMTVTVPYLRAGKYFQFGSGQVEVSVLPWVGVQPLWVSGSGSFVLPGGPPGPPMPTTVKFSLDDYELDGITGINLKVTLFHFFQVEGKYQAVFNANALRSVVTVDANLFFTRNWGLTYRFKYAEETSTSTDIYHMFGVAFMF
jgi:hypothetical protein